MMMMMMYYYYCYYYYYDDDDDDDDDDDAALRLLGPARTPAGRPQHMRILIVITRNITIIQTFVAFILKCILYIIFECLSEEGLKPFRP